MPSSFDFPFAYRLGALAGAGGLGVTGATALLGTLSAVGATVRLAPAEAMRPPAPGQYRRTVFERLGVRGMPAGLRMVLRNMERRPLRTLLTIGGTAAAVAIVVMGNFFRDAIDHIVDTTFELSMRSDVNVWMAEPVDALAALQLARLPGVTAVEPGAVCRCAWYTGTAANGWACRVWCLPRSCSASSMCKAGKACRQPRPAAHRPAGRQARCARG